MRVAILLILAVGLWAGDWKPLFDGKTLNGWEVRGDGIWHVSPEGVLVGQRAESRPPFDADGKVDRANYLKWFYHQAWIYTTQEFGEFDLELEYWLPVGGNSGVSLRDKGRAEFAIASPTDGNRTPARVAYEIQLSNEYPDEFAAGSIYRFVKAPAGLQKIHDWNKLEIESRHDRITVRLNGKPAAEHPGDPARSKTGPIGLQLHDQRSLVMFRNIRIRER